MMKKLIGELQQINTLEGSLTSFCDIITGILSSSNNKLIGNLTSLQLKELIGSLKNNYINSEGNLSVPPEIPTETYEGEYVVIPKPFEEQTLKTVGLKMNNNVVINKIPYYETSNESGYTIYIGGE